MPALLTRRGYVVYVARGGKEGKRDGLGKGRARNGNSAGRVATSASREGGSARIGVVAEIFACSCLPLMN